MTIALQPKNKEAHSAEFPNGFWPALCVETPVSELLSAHYKDDTKMVIVHEHDGYAGGWFTQDEANRIYEIVSVFMNTDNCRNHRYFGERMNQLHSLLAFLPHCGGFRQV